MALSDKRKIKYLKKVIIELRCCLEDSGIDSSACLHGENPDDPLPAEAKDYILKEYRAGRL